MYMHGMIVGPCVRSMWSLRALYTRTAQYYVERIIGTRTWDFLLGFIQRRPTYVHCTALYCTALPCLFLAHCCSRTNSVASRMILYGTVLARQSRINNTRRGGVWAVSELAADTLN